MGDAPVAGVREPGLLRVDREGKAKEPEALAAGSQVMLAHLE